MATPVIINLRHAKSIAYACCLGALTIVFTGIFLSMLSDRAFSAWPLAFMLAGALMSVAGTAFLIGIAVKKPVALRMDKHGISGYYAEIATWDQIAKIGIYIGPEQHRFLGFALVDPIRFRENQSAYRRFTSWGNGRSYGYNIMVPELILKDTTVAVLLEQAQQFHTAAKSSTM